MLFAFKGPGGAFAEIQQASANLAMLDQNKDGKVGFTEWRTRARS